MKKNCVMQFEGITRIEVIDSIVGRAYTSSDANMPVLSFQDDGKTLKIFTNSPHNLERKNEEDTHIIDPMNMLVVGGVPYSHGDVLNHILETSDDVWEQEYYCTPCSLNTDAWNEIIDSIKTNVIDLSVEAWRNEVVNGLTTLGHTDWRDWKKSNAN